MPFSFKRHVLAPAVFLSIAALAANKLHGTTARASLAILTKQCGWPVSMNPMHITYTGVDGIDNTLCVLNSFFSALLRDVQGSTYVKYFALSISPPAILLPLLEAARAGRPLAIAPVIYGTLFQILGMGVILPIWCLIYILTASGTGPLPAGATETAALGMLVGFAYPCARLFYPVGKPPGPWALTTFQVFPFIQLGAGIVWRVVRAVLGRKGGNGYVVAQLIWVSIIISSAVGHWGLLPLPQLASLLVPGTEQPFGIEHATRLFIQWDGFCVLASTAALTLFIARSAMETIQSAVVMALGSAIAGPGAGIAAVWALREGRLESERRAKKQ